METSTRPRPNTAAPGDGSRTLTMTNDPTKEEDEDDQGTGSEGGQAIGSLRLRGGPRKNQQRVAWNEDVVDNEGCGKKKSKICCIYHKPRRFDESSDESDSDSDDSSCDGHGNAGHNHNHNHNHNHHDQPHAGPSNSNGRQSRPEPQASTVHELELPEAEPNAYEKQPGQKGKRKAA